MQNAKSSLRQMKIQRLYGIPRENNVTVKIPQTFQGWNNINQNFIQTIARSYRNTAEHSIHDSVRSQVQIQEIPFRLKKTPNLATIMSHCAHKQRP